MELKRDVLDTMIAWKTKRNRKPMLLQGARQVGKTTSVRSFAVTHYNHFVEVNFIKTPLATK